MILARAILGRTNRRSLVVAALVVAALVVAACPAVGLALDPPNTTSLTDPAYDVMLRPTDAGRTAPFDPASHRPINLLGMNLGRWSPDAPATDLFTGTFGAGGTFLRLDVDLAGLVNPPGDTDPIAFEPFRYGPHPVYGFIEFDMDGDADTGGELDAPQYRYLGNVGRFGGLPTGDAYHDRPAVDPASFDVDFLSEPYLERSGEEFHLALLGGQFADAAIAELVGDGDLLFEAGETWTIVAKWFHRAHGFEPFSLAVGGAVAGEYSPPCTLRFAHDPVADTTRLSLVFPLTNAAAASMTGTNPQPHNHNPADQASINEALQDLRESAQVVDMFPSGDPAERLIRDWKDKPSGQFLNPGEWRATALLGTTYTAAGYGFIWTDVYPNVIRGNVDGAYAADADDVEEIDDYIAAHDADDGQVDGQAVLAGDAADFAVYDVNADGVVNAVDLLLVAPAGDCNGDRDVDLADYAVWQRCQGTADAGSGPCALADLNGDQQVDLNDFQWFLGMFSPTGM